MFWLGESGNSERNGKKEVMSELYREIGRVVFSSEHRLEQEQLAREKAEQQTEHLRLDNDALVAENIRLRAQLLEQELRIAEIEREREGDRERT